MSCSKIVLFIVHKMGWFVMCCTNNTKMFDHIVSPQHKEIWLCWTLNMTRLGHMLNPQYDKAWSHAEPSIRQGLVTCRPLNTTRLGTHAEPSIRQGLVTCWNPRYDKAWSHAEPSIRQGLVTCRSLDTTRLGHMPNPQCDKAWSHAEPSIWKCLIIYWNINSTLSYYRVQHMTELRHDAEPNNTRCGHILKPRYG